MPDQELLRCRLLGLSGSGLLALGGAAAGAVPVRDPFSAVPALRELRAAPGLALICAYLGLTLLVAAWLRLGRLVERGHQAEGEQPPSPRELVMVLAWWAAPLVVGPPLFSRDVYSYLAQGAMVVQGLDVYTFGPAALGGPLVMDVSPVWRDTPAPYGPVFLTLAAMVARASTAAAATTADAATDAVPLGVLELRAVALVGVGLLVLWLPRLAQRCGVCPSRALWLGVLNPLVLAHLVGGAHNDALMLGLLVCGLTAALARRPVAGIVLVIVAMLVKAPAGLALAACAAIWANQLTGGWRLARAAAGTAAVAGTAVVALTVLTGGGYGWVGALETPARVYNGLSLSTDLGRLLAMSDGLGDAGVPLMRSVGLALAGVACVLLWLRIRQLGPVYALGLALTSVVVLGPVVHVWYLLWGVIPIAAAAPDGPVRRWTARACAVFALILLPHGNAPNLAAVGQAALGAGLAALVLLATRESDRTGPVTLPA